MLSFLEQYWDFKVLINHLTTCNIFTKSGVYSIPEDGKLGSKVFLLTALLIDSKRSGCSAQYWEYSVNETGDKINGGAVNEDKSPLKLAILFRKEVHEEELAVEEDFDDSPMVVVFPILKAL